MSYYYGRRWRKMLRPHWAGGEYQAPSGDLLIHVAHLSTPLVDAPTIGQTHVITSADASLTPTLLAAPYFAEVGTNDSMTVTGSVLDETTADIIVSGIEVAAGTIYCVVLPSAEAAPSGAQIVAGTDSNDAAAVWSGAKSILDGTDDVTLYALELTDETSYKAHVVHEAVDDTLSTVASSAAFIAADVSAPVLSSGEIFEGDDYTEYSIATMTVNTDTGEGTLYAVLTTSSTAPSAAQVVAGQDHTGATAPWGGSVAVVDHGPQELSAVALASNTQYWGYFVHVDAASPSVNTSTVFAAPATITTPDATVIVNVLRDGTSSGVSIANANITEDYADPDGGSNAILIENNGTSTNLTIQDFFVYGNGINRMSISLKDVASSTGTRWARLRAINVSSTNLTHINIAGGSGGTSVTDLGSGWYRFTFEIDMTGDADLNGGFQIWFADSNNDTTIPLTSAGSEAIAAYDFKVEVLTNGFTAAEPTLGTITVDAPTAGEA